MFVAYSSTQTAHITHGDQLVDFDGVLIIQQQGASNIFQITIIMAIYCLNYITVLDTNG
jgi:hypothetical protein